MNALRRCRKAKQIQIVANKFYNKTTTMNTSTLNSLKCTAACLSAILFIACESHEQKADDAFERVKVEKKIDQDSGGADVVMQQPIIQEIKTPEAASLEVKKADIQVVYQDEWTLFRTETEKKIRINESKIKAIKSAPGTSAKMLDELSGKEKDYNDLRRKLDEYSLEMKETLGKFKVKMNHEVNEISIDLNDLTVNNKK